MKDSQLKESPPNPCRQRGTQSIAACIACIYCNNSSGQLQIAVQPDRIHHMYATSPAQTTPADLDISLEMMKRGSSSASPQQQLQSSSLQKHPGISSKERDSKRLLLSRGGNS